MVIGLSANERAVFMKEYLYQLCCMEVRGEGMRLALSRHEVLE